MALNTVTLAGRLTADPELRYTYSEKPVVSFTRAVDRDGRDAGTDFINCVAWEKTAQFVEQYFKKGAAMSLVGRLQIRSYEDRDGHKRTAAEVVANKVYFAGGKPAEDKPRAAQFVELDDSDGELPF